MADTLLLDTTPTSRKRSHYGEILPGVHTGLQAIEDVSASPTTHRASSPVPSNTDSSLTELTDSTAQALACSATSQPQNKKRKLTFAEKQVEKAVRKQEKEDREKQKAAERAKKEEEKRLRDEEKRRKNEEKETARKAKEHEKEVVRQAQEQEREEKKKAKDAKKQERDAEKAQKDAEKAQKDADKAQKEAEKLKKERNQMRIGAFFGRPAPAATPPSTPDDVSVGTVSRRSSIASIILEDTASHDTAQSAPSKFAQWFLPFFTPDHTVLAPDNRYRAGRRFPIDFELNDPQISVEPLKSKFGKPRQLARNLKPIKEIVKLIAQDNEADRDQATCMLRKTTYKIISFSQDVRPPYQGTYTRPISPRSSRRLAINPTSRELPDTNYDYDSEAEWQEPEEGDVDLEDEDEMSEDEEDGEEMNDFLDDEADPGKRRLVVGEMEPRCSGLFWDGESDPSQSIMDLSVYRMDFLDDSTKLPINPYSPDHWSVQPKPTPTKQRVNLPSSTCAMQPPRTPLATMNTPNTVAPLFVTNSGTTTEQQNENTAQGKQRGRQNPNKPLKMIPNDVMPAFKAAVNGSDLNKVALIEILKKQFPKCPKDAIKDTLSTIAVRQGAKESEKRWVLLA